jgi:hypothetical protein
MWMATKNSTAMDDGDLARRRRGEPHADKNGERSGRASARRQRGYADTARLRGLLRKCVTVPARCVGASRWGQAVGRETKEGCEPRARRSVASGLHTRIGARPDACNSEGEGDMDVGKD